jgi:hemerythrin-like domain-containing protein
MAGYRGEQRMAIQIGAKPDSGFDDPIGMLIDCHRRIERFLHVLCVVADRARNRALTDEEVTASDEEKSLFPRLRAESIAANFEEIGRLEDDHRNANDLHATVDALYTAWIASGHLNSEDEQRLRSATEQLKHLYQEHIQVEEKIVFPRAAEMLDSGTITAIGQEFHARRR